MSSSTSQQALAMTEEPNKMSQNKFLKEAGYRNFQHFMQSYGLKNIVDDDELEEAKAILSGLRQLAQLQWEMEDKGTGK